MLHESATGIAFTNHRVKEALATRHGMGELALLLAPVGNLITHPHSRTLQQATRHPAGNSPRDGILQPAVRAQRKQET